MSGPARRDEARPRTVPPLVAGAVASALLYAASQPPWSLPLLAYVALVPWLVTSRRLGPWSAAASGVLMGSVAGALVAVWIPSAVSALGGGLRGGALATAAVVVSGIPFGVLGGVSGLLRRSGTSGRILGLAVAVVLVDLWRSYAPGGVPWALLGHSQWNVPGVAQLAAAGGVPLVSGVVALVNAAIASAIACERAVARRRSLVWVGAAAGGALACAVAGLPVVESVRGRAAGESEREPPFELLALQPRIPPGELWAPGVQRTHVAMLERQVLRALESRSERPQLVVLPENAITRPVDRGDALGARLAQLPRRAELPVLLGAVRSAPDDAKTDSYRSSALWLARDGRTIDALDKVRAVPWAEALPARGGLLAFLLGGPSGPRLRTGGAERALGRDPSLAVVLCYEAAFPGAVARRRARDTAAIVQLSSETWSSGGAVTAQQLAYASFRAIEQRLPLLRVVLGGGSARTDRFGRVVEELGGEAPSAFIAPAGPGPPPLARANAALLGLYALGAGTGGAGVAITLRRNQHARIPSSPARRIRAPARAESGARG